MIAIFCGRLLAGEQPTVFGDGLQTRDYVYVDDVVGANLAAAASSANGPFNVGCGVEISVLELVSELQRLGGRPFEPVHAPERRGEVRHIALDPGRARAELGWEARTPLARGLERTLVSVGLEDELPAGERYM